MSLGCNLMRPRQWWSLFRQFTGCILFIPSSSPAVIISTLSFGEYEMALFLLVTKCWLEITILSWMGSLNRVEGGESLLNCIWAPCFFHVAVFRAAHKCLHLLVVQALLSHTVELSKTGGKRRLEVFYKIKVLHDSWRSGSLFWSFF